MKTNTKRSCRLLDTAYKTTQDLDRVGFIDERKMQKIEALWE